MEFAPCSAAGRREGEDREVKLNDGLIVNTVEKKFNKPNDVLDNNCKPALDWTVGV